MIRFLFQFTLCGFILSSVSAWGQEATDSIQVLDQKYLEDQFYTGVAYNVLLDTPDEMDQRNFSYNLQVGFIKDIPLNKRRNFGLGLGVGYAANSYYSNVVASEEENGIAYNVAVDADFNRSKLETHAIEFPLELRWRTSTAADYKFWRVYAGVKLGYVFSGRSKLVMDSGNESFSNPDIETFQYGLMLNFGYNTWNVHAYYSLNSVLADGPTLNGTALELNVLRIGLIFYIL